MHRKCTHISGRLRRLAGHLGAAPSCSDNWWPRLRRILLYIGIVISYRWDTRGDGHRRIMAKPQKAQGLLNLGLFRS